jgi:hypothetical protein
MVSCIRHIGPLCVSVAVNNSLYGPSSCTSKTAYLYFIRALGFPGIYLTQLTSNFISLCILHVFIADFNKLKYYGTEMGTNGLTLTQNFVKIGHVIQTFKLTLNLPTTTIVAQPFLMFC